MPVPASPRRAEPPGPSELEAEIAARTDTYFKRTRAVVQGHGPSRVTYAVFMRRPVIFCPRLAVEWLQRVAAERGVSFDIDTRYEEGAWVGAGEPLMYITGPFAELVDLETLYLQKLGPACVAAYNAYAMCCDLPKARFIAMDARHCAGGEMAETMAYAASVGARAAQRAVGAAGFIGTSTDACAHFFNTPRGIGTMPHALIGYAGSTLRAAEMYVDSFPDEPLTVLVDYYGQEVTDALAVCRRFPDMAARGDVGIRLDTHGGRFMEGLDPQASYAVLERHVPNAIRQYRSEEELRWLVGTGVTGAAIWSMREELDRAGFPKVKIVASSGFTPAKCKVMSSVQAPIDVVGTGSYLPQQWTETYATADIIEYDGRPSVKVGREFLFRR